MTLPADFGGGFSGSLQVQGGQPVWELGLGNGVLHLTADPTGYYATKVMWIVGPNSPQPVTLSSQAVSLGTPPLWFDIYPSIAGQMGPDNPDIYGTSAVLDPTAPLQPNRNSTDNHLGHWNIWGIGIFALAAGCYTLQVTWPSGSWQMMLAVGS